MSINWFYLDQPATENYNPLMKFKLLLFLAGLLVGAGLTITTLSPRHSAELEHERAEAAKLQALVETSQQEAAKLQAANLQLAAEVQAARTNSSRRTTASARAARSAGNAWASMFGGRGESNKFSSAMGGLMKAAMAQQVESQLSTLKFRLKLSDPQAAEVRAILEKQFGAAGDMATRMFQGKLDTNEVLKARSSLGDSHTQINALLSPEQQAAYAAYLEDERHTHAATAASVEVAQLQTALQLDPDQQQKVYNVIYDQTLKVMSAADQKDGQHWDWQKSEADKLAALRSVLTAEQLAAYEKQAEAKQQMLNSLMQSFGGDTNGASSIGVSFSTIGN